MPDLYHNTNDPILYRHITELPLRNFIECAVTGNLAFLIKSGHKNGQPAQPFDLHEAWAEIQAQYSEAMGNHKQRLVLNLYRQIVRIQNTLFQINECVRVLTDTHCKEFAALLNELLGSSFQFDPRFAEDYDRDLKRAVSKSKRFKLELDLKVPHYQELLKEQEGGAAATREGFIVTLIALTNHAHCPVTDAITVFEYVTRIKQLNEYIEHMQKAKK